MGPISGSPVGRVLSFVKKFLDFLCWKIVYEVTITCFFFLFIILFSSFSPWCEDFVTFFCDLLAKSSIGDYVEEGLRS